MNNIIKLHPDRTYHKNPEGLTSNQVRWMDRYLLKSGDDYETFVDPPTEYHEVCEWKNGWCDYTVDGDILWIWTLYSHRTADQDGLDMGKGGDAMDVAVHIAKANDCKYIDFDTTRTVKSWKTSTEKHGKLKVMSRQLRVVLKKNKKK
jgi:hypothetical protein